jgi:hypothetical protein
MGVGENKSEADTAGFGLIYDLSKAAHLVVDLNNSTDALLLAVMARLIRVESMVCSLSILNMKHMTGDDLGEYQSLARWLGAVRARIVETSVKSHAEQFPELAKFLEEHIELSERDLTEMFERAREQEE